MPKHEKSLIEAIVDVGECGIILLDESHNIILWNNWMYRASGIATTAAVNRPLKEVFPDIAGRRVFSAINDAIRRGASSKLSHALNKRVFSLYCAAGATVASRELMEHQIVIKPVAAEGGARHCLIQVSDITAAIKREKMLREIAQRAQASAREAEKLSRIKSEFISVVSHELRTPLTSINGSLSLVAGGVAGDIPDQARALVEIAMRNTERLLRLINDILDVAKIESGKMNYHFEPLKLAELLDASAVANRAFADQFGVSIEVYNSTPDVRISGDRARLMQVMTNLLSNAAKFSPRDGCVRVKAECNDGVVRISVSDRGHGIPGEFRAQIFGKFAQADSTDTRQRGGTGLGLNIAKAIVQNHKGEIGFDSIVDKGTTFYFDLPELLSEQPSVLPSRSQARIDGDVALCE